MTATIPNATYEGSVDIAGIILHCYLLDDGKRIIDMEGVNQLLQAFAEGLELSDEDALKLASVKDGRTVMERKS
jgi:hypothetical protein